MTMQLNTKNDHTTIKCGSHITFGVFLRIEKTEMVETTWADQHLNRTPPPRTGSGSANSIFSYILTVLSKVIILLILSWHWINHIECKVIEAGITLVHLFGYLLLVKFKRLNSNINLMIRIELLPVMVAMDHTNTKRTIKFFFLLNWYFLLSLCNLFRNVKDTELLSCVNIWSDVWY